MTGRSASTTSFARAVLSLLVVVACAAPAGARSLPTPAQVDDPPATIELTERSPWVSDTQPVTLDVTTTGDTADTTIRVRVHPPLVDAAELETSMTEDVGGITRSVDLGPTDDIPVSPSGTRRIVLTGEEIRFPGVHPVVVELRSPEGGVVDLVRTPVIRLGTDDDPLPAPRLSIVVDVAIEPTVGPDGRREPTPTEVGRLGGLADFLDELARIDPTAPRTVLAVPDTLDALAAARSVRAADVLERLTDAAAVDPVAFPYVPVSAAALHAAGLGDVLDEAIDVGTLTLADRLGAAPDPSLWPSDDVSAAVASQLAARGVETILTTQREDESGGGDEDGDERLLVPAGPRPVPALATTELTALVADEATSAVLTGGVEDRVDAIPTALADLILRDDGRSSNLVVRLDDVPDGSLLVAALPLLTADDSPVPLVPVPTAGVTRDPDEEDLPDPVDLSADSGGDSEPGLGRIADRYRDVQRQIATFEAFAGTGSARSADLVVQQLTSVADGLDLDERNALLDAVESVVRGGFDGIAITGQTDLNLTSRRGALPVAIANANDFPVRVMVRIRSDRLRFPDGEEFTVTAEPDITRLDIPVEALATGSVPTFVELRTPDGSLLLDDRQLNVRSTAVSGVGLALSLGALAVLAIWWVRTWRKNRTSGDTGEPSTD